MSHRLLTTFVNMSTIVNSPLQIGLKVEHEGAYYKIINFYRQQNSVNQYIIQSLSTGKTKRVFRHQICDAEISSMFSALTDKTIFQFDHEESQSDDDLLMVLDATEMIIEPPPKKQRFKDMPTGCVQLVISLLII